MLSYGKLNQFKTVNWALGRALLGNTQTMLSKNKKDQIIKKFGTHSTDTGSPQVQIAILTAEMKELAKHLKEHKKDFSSRRGLLRKVGERRKLLKYLEREDDKAYAKLLENLKL